MKRLAEKFRSVTVFLKTELWGKVIDIDKLAIRVLWLLGRNSTAQAKLAPAEAVLYFSQNMVSYLGIGRGKKDTKAEVFIHEDFGRLQYKKKKISFEKLLDILQLPLASRK